MKQENQKENLFSFLIIFSDDGSSVEGKIFTQTLKISTAQDEVKKKKQTRKILLCEELAVWSDRED